jgi:hypothetical protein
MASPQCSPQTIKGYVLQDLITFSLGLLISGGLPLSDVALHFELEDGDIYKELVNDMGLTKEGIPMIYGGSWTFGEWLSWCHK